jgi:hypothetical protein
MCVAVSPLGASVTGESSNLTDSKRGDGVPERQGREKVGVQIPHHYPSQPTTRCQNIRHRLRRGSPPARHSYNWIPMPSRRFPRLLPVFVCRGPQELCRNV